LAIHSKICRFYFVSPARGKRGRKQIINLMNHKEHLTLLGLNKILAFKRSLNLGLSDEIKTNFPQISSIERPVVTVKKIIEPNWLSGFTSGEGCFHVRMKNSTKYKSGVP